MFTAFLSCTKSDIYLIEWLAFLSQENPIATFALFRLSPELVITQRLIQSPKLSQLPRPPEQPAVHLESHWRPDRATATVMWSFFSELGLNRTSNAERKNTGYEPDNYGTKFLFWWGLLWDSFCFAWHLLCYSVPASRHRSIPPDHHSHAHQRPTRSVKGLGPLQNKDMQQNVS